MENNIKIPICTPQSTQHIVTLVNLPKHFGMNKQFPCCLYTFGKFFFFFNFEKWTTIINHEIKKCKTEMSDFENKVQWFSFFFFTLTLFKKREHIVLNFPKISQSKEEQEWLLRGKKNVDAEHFSKVSLDCGCWGSNLLHQWWLGFLPSNAKLNHKELKL